MLSELLHPHLDGSPIRGTFRLTAYREGLVDGRHQATLTLEDASGRFDRIYADGDPAPIREMGCPALVRGVLWPDYVDGQITATVESLEAIEVEEVENGAELLPFASCNVQALPALRTLIAFNALITHPVLKSFLNRVLLDEAIAEPLMTHLPNERCAHRFKGGLLPHCTEWLDEAGRLARLVFVSTAYGAQSEKMVAITQLAYLFHDFFGAVLTERMLSGSDRLRGILIQKLLAPELYWLSLKDPEAARDLRMLLMPLDGRFEEPGWHTHARAIIQRCDDLRQARDSGRQWALRISAELADRSNRNGQRIARGSCHV